jgi:hypothetical protein
LLLAYRWLNDSAKSASASHGCQFTQHHPAGPVARSVLRGDGLLIGSPIAIFPLAEWMPALVAQRSRARIASRLLRSASAPRLLAARQSAAKSAPAGALRQE